MRSSAPRSSWSYTLICAVVCPSWVEGSARRARGSGAARALASEQTPAHHEHLREAVHGEAKRIVELGVEVLADVLGPLCLAADAVAVGDGHSHVRVAQAAQVHLHHPGRRENEHVERPDALLDHYCGGTLQRRTRARGPRGAPRSAATPGPARPAHRHRARRPRGPRSQVAARSSRVPAARPSATSCPSV